MTESITTLFESSLKRYQAGEKAETLIPVFAKICARLPKNAMAWNCLAWLYLLVDKPNQALKAAKKSVKLDGKSAGGRINLALAMLDVGETGVRPHIQAAQQMMRLDSEVRSSVTENIEDGLTRKPEWDSLRRVKNWLTN
ncbi:MAG: hypothetical protein DSM107014_06935 [Gomphosphaeria aponina SAG 52.96 = DSM 107014]|uniref:TPR-like protein n=1 Tax=Gomphosphaeria aponina SAG 52.96 = DSM 107014 TaxID=1521640 RepID=A0A941GXK7_9CHRO|nr:hypothetical protein [Gomphosphaeria aponina SAG 52.96 = DSM 107014]